MKTFLKNAFKKLRYKDYFWLLSFLIILTKSNLFLAIFRTPNSAYLDFSTMYFGVPPIGTHIFFSMLFIAPVLLFKGRGKLYSALALNVVLSIMLVLNLWYYRAYQGFYSIRHIMHPELFNPLARSIVNFKFIDIIFFIDIIILTVHIFRNKDIYKNIKRNAGGFVIVTALGCGWIFFDHLMIDVWEKGMPGQMVFRNSWAPFQTMSNLSPIGYWTYDIYRTLNEGRDYKLSSQEEEKISNWLKWKKENISDNNYKAILKGKNIIALQIESLENFVINSKVHNQEVTPNLNRMLSNSLYFNNLYEQNSGGTSSDADLMFNTGLLPTKEGAVVFRYPSREVETLPKLLQGKGYKTISAKAEKPGSWNWVEMHKGTYKFQEVWDINSFKIDEIIGLGLSDGSALSQIEEKIKDIKKPYYLNYSTLSTHGPFEIPEEKKYLKLPENLDKNILGAYFQSLRYMDEEVGRFIKKLEESGDLKDTVIVIYGDHGGVHKFYSEEMADAELSGDWWKKYDEKIPFIIYNPDIKGEVIETVGGTADMFSTTAYLIGIEEDKFIDKSYGRILVKTNRNFALLEDGRIMGEAGVNDKPYVSEARDISDMIIRSNYFKSR